MPAQASSMAVRASWDVDMDNFLIEAMTDQVKAGKRAESGFKKEAWVAVHEAINERFNKSLSIQQIKTRVQTLKTKYTTISAMLQASGFGWDANHNVVLVHDDVWQQYIKEHPKAVDYRKKAVPYYDELVDLFEGTYATGEYALSSDEPHPSDFITGPNSSDEGTSTPAVLVSMDATPATTALDGVQSTELNHPAARDGSCGTAKDKPQQNRNRRRDSGGAMIADAISEVAFEMRSRTARMKALTPSQKAVKVLQTVYAERFSAYEMAQAFDVTLDENKARLFCGYGRRRGSRSVAFESSTFSGVKTTTWLGIPVSDSI